MTLAPFVTFEEITSVEASAALVRCEHYLGPCNRPFGKQSFGLFVNQRLASVAVSASTVNRTCAGYPRTEVVELARLGSLPGSATWTRVALRCWREIAPQSWPHWRVKACVSYSNETRHTGDIYRFDGWKKVAVVRGSTGGGTYSKRQPSEAKAVWVFRLPEAA